MPNVTLVPQVKWAQRKHFIALSVYVGEFEAENINVTKLYMEFSGSGIGAAGRNKYAFEIQFYKDVETESELMHSVERWKLLLFRYFATPVEVVR